MSPLRTPKASSRTLTIGTKQLVVHDAFDTTTWRAGSKASSLTPITKVASASFDGPEMTTRCAPPSRWAAAPLRDVKRPVDSTTTSTPSSPQGSALGSRSARTRIALARHHDGVALGAHLGSEAPVGGVVAQEMGVGGGVGEVVERHHLDIGALGPHGAQEIPADAPEAVDPHPYRHQALSDQTAEGDRQSRRIVRPPVGLGQRHLHHLHVERPEGDGGRVGEHHVDLDPVRGQGGHVVGHVEARPSRCPRGRRLAT